MRSRGNVLKVTCKKEQAAPIAITSRSSGTSSVALNGEIPPNKTLVCSGQNQVKTHIQRIERQFSCLLSCRPAALENNKTGNVNVPIGEETVGLLH